MLKVSTLESRKDHVRPSSLDFLIECNSAVRRRARHVLSAVTSSGVSDLNPLTRPAATLSHLLPCQRHTDLHQRLLLESECPLSRTRKRRVASTVTQGFKGILVPQSNSVALALRRWRLFGSSIQSVFGKFAPQPGSLTYRPDLTM